MSFISGISVASIALGVMALIIVLSVMNGFQKEVRDRMLSVLSHAEVYNLAGSVGNWQDTLGTLKAAESYSNFCRSDCFIVVENRVSPFEFTNVIVRVLAPSAPSIFICANDLASVALLGTRK